MITCIIVEDEPLANDLLESYIRQQPELSLVRKCSNVPEAFEVLLREKIDLMFLDIRMPSISGIDFLRSLKDPPHVIFTTAYPEYALTGFELDAVDYLLKPITPERFEKSIRKLLRIRQDEAPEKKDYTYFKVSGKLIRVFHKELLFAQSVKDYILLHTVSGKYLTHMTMKYIAELLPADTFVRVHRSYLVNKTCIDVFDKTVVQIGAEKIPVSDNYRQNLAG